MDPSRRAAVLAGLALMALAGCKEAGRSNVRVHLALASGVTGLTSVKVSATQGSPTPIKEAEFDWPSGATSLDVGLLVPADITGEIQVVAAGAANGGTAVSQVATVTVTAGKATEVLQLILQLVPNTTLDGGSDGGDDARVDTGAGLGGAGGGTGVGGTTGAGGAGAGGRSDAGADAGTDAGTDTPIAARAWQTAIKAENNIDEMDLRPAVAIDASGNALAVWEHGTQIWFNRYDAVSATWGTEGPAVVAGGPGVSVGLDSQGVATVTWQGTSTADMGIWTASTVAGGSWGVPVRLSTANAADVHLAVAANGTAIAVWTENNHVSAGGNEYILWVSRRMPGGAWSAKTMLKNATELGDRIPTAALDPAGNGFVIWEQPPPQPDPDSTNSVWISRFSGGVFGTPQTVESYTAGDADSGHIALNASGNGVASWRQIGNSLELWTRAYENGAWGTPTLVSTSSSIAYYQVPEVAIDGAGNSVVVWSQGTASSIYQARISRHRVGQAAWDAPIALETDNQSGGLAGTDDVSPEVRMDAAGNATVIWRKKGTNGLINLWSRRLDATGALGAPARIDNQNLHSVFGHDLAVSANGVAVAVWYYGSEFDIWANVFR